MAADNASNNSVDAINKVNFGDPSKFAKDANGNPILGPDGKPMPDTGYFGLKGADQLNARADYESKIAAILKENRASLSTPDSQFKYDGYMRRFQQRNSQIAGQSSERAYNEWALGTAKTQLDQAIEDAARHADDDNLFNGAVANGKDAAVKAAQLRGVSGKGLDTEANKAAETLWATRLESLGITNPAGAYDMALKHKNELGDQFAPVARSLQAKSDQVTGAAGCDKLFADARAGAGKTAVAAGTVPPAPVNGNPDALKTRVENVKPAGPDCVPLVQALTGAPPVGQWTRGDNALATKPPIGTAVATFMNRDGSPSDRYDGGVGVGIRGNNTTHAGVVAGYTADGGMILWEQYVGSGGPKLRTYYPTGTGEQNASNYFTIKTGQPVGPGSYPAMGGVATPAGTANASMPVSSPGGMAAYKQRVGQIENPAGDPNATSPTGARGFFQWVGSTAKQYGVIPGNRDSEEKGMDRLSADNLAALHKGLGREPTPEELYLAHQQGAGGALQLILHPTERAGDIVGDAAVRNNGGDPNGSAAQFVNLWRAKYDRVKPSADGTYPVTPGGGHIMPGGGNSGNLPITPAAFETGAPAPSNVVEPGAPPAPPAPADIPRTPSIEEAKAAAIAAAEARPDWSPAQKAAARARIVEQAAEAAISEQETQRQKKDREEKQANGYFQRIYSGQDLTGVVKQIANDQYITDVHLKENLIEVAKRMSGTDTEEMTEKGGKKYWDYYKRVTAYPGDPNRVADEREIYSAVASHELTVAGGNELVGTMAKMRKSDESAAFQRTLASQMEYAKKEMSRDGDTAFPGVPQSMMRDPKGEAKFLHIFKPLVEGKIKAAEEAGKDPSEVIMPEKIDEMIESVYPKAERRQDRMSDATQVVEPPNTPLPTAPPNVRPEIWTPLITAPPAQRNGQPVTHYAWGKVLEALAQDPSPRTVAMLKASTIWGRMEGVDYDKIAAQLQGERSALYRPEDSTKPTPPSAENSPEGSRLKTSPLFPKHLVEGGGFHPENAISPAGQRAVHGIGKAWNAEGKGLEERGGEPIQ